MAEVMQIFQFLDSSQLPRSVVRAPAPIVPGEGALTLSPRGPSLPQEHPLSAPAAHRSASSQRIRCTLVKLVQLRDNSEHKAMTKPLERNLSNDIRNSWILLGTAEWKHVQ